MRKVIWSKYFNNVEELNPLKTNWQLEEVGEAIFHSWGVNYEELEGGPGNFTSAIIELEDGTVKNIPAEHVRFISGELDKVTVEGSPVKLELKKG